MALVRSVSRDQDLAPWTTRLPRFVYVLAQRIDNLSLRVLDIGVVALAWLVGIGAGYEFVLPDGFGRAAVWMLGIPIVAQLGLNRLAGLYGPIWRYASVEEAGRVVVAVASGLLLSTVTLGTFSELTDTPAPVLTTPAIAGLLILLGCGGIRFQARLFSLERQRATGPAPARALIVGAGPTGLTLAYELSHADGHRDVQVLGFVDDDPELRGRSLRGLPVLGTTAELNAICKDRCVERILMALPDTTSASAKQAMEQALRTDAQVKMLAPTSETVGQPLVRSIRDLDVTDLLGREHATVDCTEIGEYLAGATVLITGAGGSIGSEIARQVARYAPGRLLLLDRDETLLHDAITGPLSEAEPLLVDIRDRRRLQGVFQRYRPDVVFHAAAQKHVPMLERHPVEAVRTNVLGTWLLAMTAAEFGVERFVHISTDKAADPCSVMGATKRVAEQIVFAIGRHYEAPFVAVRFGNVLGSRGSVVPTFLRQILDGGPVTITDPGMTRYFMTIPEAVSLVLQSGAMADHGKILLLDMGEPVPIVELAHQMIRLAGLRAGEDIDITITGARPGERLHERLHDDAEVIEPANHPSISALAPKVPWDVAELVPFIDEFERRCDDGDPGVSLVLEKMLRHGNVDCQLRRPCATRTIDLTDSTVESQATLDGQLPFDVPLSIDLSREGVGNGSRT